MEGTQPVPRAAKIGGMAKAGRVVVAEDAPAVADVLCKYLTHAGFVVALADDGAAALHLIEVQSPDIVVSDILMPTVSGIELLRRLRASAAHRHTPVVFFTGLPSDNADVATAVEAPLVRVVQKGRPFHCVLDAIAELLSETACAAVSR